MTYYKFDCYSKIFLPEEINEEELFLMSFPSFNPVVVAFILSSKISCYELLNLECKELCDKFHYIPERFLKLFYKFVHDTVDLNSRMSDNKTEKSIKTVQKHSYSEPRMFEIRQKSSSEENKLTTYLERCQSMECYPNQHFNTSHTNSQKSDTSSDEYADMSVEEIDRSYRELLLQDLKPTSFNVPCGRSSQIKSCASATMSSKNNFSSESFSYSQKSKRRKISPNSDVTHPYFVDEHSFDSSNTKQNSSHPLVPFVNSKIRETYDLVMYDDTKRRKKSQNFNVTHHYSLDDHSFGSSDTKQNSSHPLVPFVNSYIQEMYHDTDMKLFKSMHKDGENTAVPKSTLSQLGIAEFKCTSQRKIASNLTNLQKTVHKCSQLSALCNNPSRVQKGVSSQTVCKRVSFKNGQVAQSTESSSSQYFQTSDSPPNCSYQTQSLPTNGKIHKLEGRSHSKSLEKFGASCFSQGNVFLTPRETHRLSYEKIPGKKGQTRLIFK